MDHALTAVFNPDLESVLRDGFRMQPHGLLAGVAPDLQGVGR
jgi:hypothetical protein